MATRPLATAVSRCFRRLSATATPPSAGPSAVPPAGSTPPPSAALAFPPSSSSAGGSTAPSTPKVSPAGEPAGAPVASTAAAGPPSGAAAAAADAPLPPPDVHSTSLGLDPTIDPVSVDPLRYRKAAWKYGGALLLFLPAYTYLTQFAIPEAEARKAVRLAKAKAAEEEVEAAKAKAAEGRVVAPVLPRSMRSSWAGESPVAVRDGAMPGAAEGQMDGEALMAAAVRQQAEAQQEWERQRHLQAAGGGEPPPAAGAADPPLLPGLGSAPLRGATDAPVHQMFPGVKEESEGTVSAADELALRVRRGNGPCSGVRGWAAPRRPALCCLLAWLRGYWWWRYGGWRAHVAGLGYSRRCFYFLFWHCGSGACVTPVFDVVSGGGPLRGGGDGDLLQEVELAVKLKKLRSLPPSADVDTQRAALLSEVEAVTAEMRALGSPPPGTASSP